MATTLIPQKPCQSVLKRIKNKIFSGQFAHNNLHLAPKSIFSASPFPYISASGFSFICGLAGERAGVEQNKFHFGALKSRFEL